MEANAALSSSHHPFPFIKRPSLLRKHSLLPLTTLRAANNSENNNISENNENKADTASATRLPINTLNIRYKPRSKRQAKLQQEQQQQQSIKPRPPPKEWESMTLGEKAMELYVGEKGLLFWLNKFAYASIYIIIGGWILFRFVGPNLGLYQLDAPPLSPTDVLKGSPQTK